MATGWWGDRLRSGNTARQKKTKNKEPPPKQPKGYWWTACFWL